MSLTPDRWKPRATAVLLVLLSTVIVGYLTDLRGRYHTLSDRRQKLERLNHEIGERMTAAREWLRLRRQARLAWDQNRRTLAASGATIHDALGLAEQHALHVRRLQTVSIDESTLGGADRRRWTLRGTREQLSDFFAELEECCRVVALDDLTFTAPGSSTIGDRWLTQRDTDPNALLNEILQLDFLLEEVRSWQESSPAASSPAASSGAGPRAQGF